MGEHDGVEVGELSSQLGEALGNLAAAETDIDEDGGGGRFDERAIAGAATAENRYGNPHVTDCSGARAGCNPGARGRGEGIYDRKFYLQAARAMAIIRAIFCAKGIIMEIAKRRCGVSLPARRDSSWRWLGVLLMCAWLVVPASGQTFSRGPFRLNIGAILGATWTDNANASEDDPKSEFSIFTGPTISGDITLAPRVAGGQPLTVSLAMAYTVQYSFGDEVDDRFDAPISVSVVLPIYFYGWDVVLSDSFRFSNDPLEKTFAVGREEVPEYNNTAQVSIGRRFGRLGLNLTGSRSDRWLPDDPLQEETTYTVSLTPSYFLRDRYAVFVNGSLFWTERPDPLRSDVEGYSTSVGVTGQLTQNLSGSASVGFSHLTLVNRRQLNPLPPPKYLPLGDDNVDGITSTIALNYSNPLRPNTTYSLAFSRSPGITAALENSDITEATSVTLAIAHRLTRYVTLAPVISWIYLEDVSDIGDGEKTHILQIRTGLSRQFGRKLRGDITHTFQTRSSNLSGQSYDVNTVTATLSYQF